MATTQILTGSHNPSEEVFPGLKISQIDSFVITCLEEDVGSGDHTSNATISPSTKAEAKFLAKDNGVLAGCLVADRVFHLVDQTITVQWLKHDGDHVTKGEHFGIVNGPARALLKAERLALNIMQRMSGIASLTALMVDACKPHATKVLDTRKTAPGMRLLDKWAVLLGGGVNHRLRLDDMILIKDNHVTAAGGITAAVRNVQSYMAEHHLSIPVEVETRTLEEVQELVSLSAGVDRVMLDNMVKVRENGEVDTSMLSQALAIINRKYATEASGNVTLATTAAIAATGVDYISCGSLTHSVKALDISLKIHTVPEHQ